MMVDVGNDVDEGGYTPFHNSRTCRHETTANRKSVKNSYCDYIGGVPIVISNTNNRDRVDGAKVHYISSPLNLTIPPS